MDALKQVSSNPHVRAKDSTQGIMKYVLVALAPAAVMGVDNFGIMAALHIIITVAACVGTEYLYCRVAKKPNTIRDLSAAVTGVLLAYNLPPAAPLWIGVVGGIFAILVVKMLFGGLGANFMNPALGARAFLVLSFAGIMTNFNTSFYTGATPLAALKAYESPDLLSMFIGLNSGVIGETSALAILVGAAFLVVAGVINLLIPLTYIVTLLLFVGIFSEFGFDPYYLGVHLLGGGLMLGAFFMATDYVTRPITKLGQFVFAVLLGILTGIFRLFSGSTEGVCNSIIFCNCLVPLIEKVTWPKPFGYKAVKK